MQGRSFWEHASDAGKTCLILNVPVTYPPTPLNGALKPAVPVVTRKEDEDYYDEQHYTRLRS